MAPLVLRLRSPALPHCQLRLPEFSPLVDQAAGQARAADLPGQLPILVAGPALVPVRVRDAEALVGPEWDLCVRRVLPCIDGMAHCRAIAEAADVALPLCLAAVQQLVDARVAVLLPVCHSQQVFAATDRLPLLVRHRGLRKAASSILCPGLDAAIAAAMPPIGHAGEQAQVSKQEQDPAPA